MRTRSATPCRAASARSSASRPKVAPVSTSESAGGPRQRRQQRRRGSCAARGGGVAAATARREGRAPSVGRPAGVKRSWSRPGWIATIRSRAIPSWPRSASASARRPSTTRVARRGRGAVVGDAPERPLGAREELGHVVVQHVEQRQDGRRRTRAGSARSAGGARRPRRLRRRRAAAGGRAMPRSERASASHGARAEREARRCPQPSPGRPRQPCAPPAGPASTVTRSGPAPARVGVQQAAGVRLRAAHAAGIEREQAERDVQAAAG